MTDMLTTPGLMAGPRIAEIDGALVCRRIIDVTHDVKTFEFGPPGGAALDFWPGQYLTFRFIVDGHAVERCYTLSSSPTRPEHLAITVKRVPGGPVSNWLHDWLRVGDAVGASGPFGRFSSAIHPAERYLFLSGGSGITPMMSMVRAICDRAEPADVAFVHAARSPRDIVFREELDLIAADARVAVAAVCEDDAPGEAWLGARGRLSLPTLLALVPDLLDREIFTCGPAGFMAAVREMLGLLGHDPARYHEESFDLGAANPASETAPAGVRHRVEFRRSGRTVECAEGDTLLAAAARSGLALPSSCAEGVCGTCKSSLLAGRVDMRHAGGIRPREEAEGRILLCCSTPCEDVIVDA